MGINIGFDALLNLLVPQRLVSVITLRRTSGCIDSGCSCAGGITPVPIAELTTVGETGVRSCAVAERKVTQVVALTNCDSSMKD
jgi:hypothetical protein